MPEPLNEVCYTLPRAHSRRPAKLKNEDEKEACQRAAAPVPRISRLMALAIQLETSIAREDFDCGELARLGRVSRTRITQQRSNSPAAAAIVRINGRRSFGNFGLPVGLDFQRQKNRKPWRCQRMRVAGLTMTSALRQSKNRLRTASSQRVASLARWGLAFRS